MGVTFGRAIENLSRAANELFQADQRVRSVGIGAHGDAFGFTAVRNAAMILPAGLKRIPNEVAGIPVQFTDAFSEPDRLAKVPLAAQASFVPEQGQVRPLRCGLQIQNFTDDERTGIIARGSIIIGTLGCFVRFDSGAAAILSNNHVVAGENRGERGRDIILQNGSGALDPAQTAATLADFVDLLPSPPGANPQSGTALLNEVDAGIATVNEGVLFEPRYLPLRNLVAPSGTASAKVGDRVFKVGRTTGLTRGVVTSVANITGPIPYDPGPCWFRGVIVVETSDGTMFSNHGDSGSAVVRENGEVIGLLFAGNGQQTFVCPIDPVLSGLRCGLLTPA